MTASLPRHRDLPLDRLLDAARTGDPVGLEGLYRRFASRLLQVAQRLTGSAHDAQDIVHDLFVGLPESLRRYRDHGTLEPWLVRVTVRLALMHLRTSRRRRETSLPEAAMTPGRETADGAALAAEVETHLHRLPEGLRVVTVMCLIEGFTHDEIASLLDISPGASRVRLSRALAHLRTALR